jgi:hypothetical protein
LTSVDIRVQILVRRRRLGLGVVEFDGRDEETLAEAIELVRRFKVAGLDMVDVSFGFSTYENQIPWGPALLVPFAEAC